MIQFGKRTIRPARRAIRALWGDAVTELRQRRTRRRIRRKMRARPDVYGFGPTEPLDEGWTELMESASGATVQR